MKRDSGTLATAARRPARARRSSRRDFKRAFQRFQKDQITDHAAGLTYYTLLSLFPAAAVRRRGARLLRPAGPDRPGGGLPALRRRADGDRSTPSPRRSTAPRANRGTALDRARCSALATSLYGASGAFGAAGRALNVIWRVEEGRGVRQAQGRTTSAGRWWCSCWSSSRSCSSSSAARCPSSCSTRSGSATRSPQVWLYVRWPAGAAGDDPDLRDRLLRGAQRGDPALPVDHPGRGVRRPHLAARLGRCSSSTSRTSAPTRRPTARSRAP